MKKKIILFSLCSIVLLGMCGCESKEERKLEEIISQNDYGFGWGDYNSSGIVCEEIGNAIAHTRDYFLTSSGDIYKFNANKLFSNDKNCIKTDYGNQDLSFIYDRNFYDNNKNLVYIYDGSEKLLTPQEYKDEKGYSAYESEYLLEDYDFITLTENGDTIFIKDNIIYGYANFTDKKEKIDLGKIPQDEKIIYLSGAFIKTDKAFYTLSITNKEECNKYVDTKCKKAFTKSTLTEIYDKIIFANEDLLIDNQYRAYGKGVSVVID